MLYKLPTDIMKTENVQQFKHKLDKCDTINFASSGQVLVSTELFGGLGATRKSHMIFGSVWKVKKELNFLTEVLCFS